MRFTLSIGTRVQYTQPPKGSLNGTPSTSTSVRLTPLGPMPRSDTPCAVGCDDRLLLRRNRLKVGTCRSTSSATTAGDCRIVSFSTMFALTGTSPSRFALRVGVTVTVSSSPATASTTSTSRLAGTDCDHSAKPPARTISVRSPAGAIAMANRPSGPDTVCCSGPLVPITITDAPDTTAPESSLTMPETADWAASALDASAPEAPAAVASAKERTRNRAVRIGGDLSAIARR